MKMHFEAKWRQVRRVNRERIVGTALGRNLRIP